jgi:hypothetical protein
MHELASHPTQRPAKDRWWIRLGHAFVIEHQLSDGSLVAIPVDPSGLLFVVPHHIELPE